MLFVPPARSESPRPWTWQGIALVFGLVGFLVGFVVARMLTR